MIFQKANELKEQSISFAMITMVGVKGSAPQDLGAKCLVSTNGLEFGTVGGGKIEAYAIELAIKHLNSEHTTPETYTWNLQKDIGMTCGGEVSFMFEYFQAQSWPIVIFGAGHVSQALTSLLTKLPCQVTCIDPRKEWLDKLNPKIKKIQSNEPKVDLKDLNPKSFFISMTKGHSSDVPYLKAVSEIHPECPYIGVIGSKAKGNTIKSELKELGVDDSFIEKLIVPIGLPIGTNHPYEIAISIIAQLLEFRDQ